jgi:hypothetical protein
VESRPTSDSLPVDGSSAAQTSPPGVTRACEYLEACSPPGGLVQNCFDLVGGPATDLVLIIPEESLPPSSASVIQSRVMTRSQERATCEFRGTSPRTSFLLASRLLAVPLLDYGIAASS